MNEFSHALGADPTTGAIPQKTLDWLVENLPDSGTSEPGDGTGGTTDHRALTNRNAANQHPIGAVTGLQAALDGKSATNHTHAPASIGAAAASHQHPVSDLTATGTPSASTYLRGDGAWATPAGGDGGSGILNVSGTVDLDDVPGIREVYAVASATVEGVALAAGDAAVFRYLSGAWTYMVVGEHATWQATVAATPVTANVPTADDTANTITWTPKTGVQYVIGGQVRTPPYNVGDVDATVTVTAQATSGYVLQGTTSWTFNFTGSEDPDTPVTASGPTWTDDTENGGGTWTTPTETGVTYSPASGTATPEQTVTVTATAQNGYVLQGTTSWSHTFPAAPGGPAAPDYAETFTYPDATEMNQKNTEIGNTPMFSSSGGWLAGSGLPSGSGALVYGGQFAPPSVRGLAIAPWEYAGRDAAAVEVDYNIPTAGDHVRIGIGNQGYAAGFRIMGNGNVYESDSGTVLGTAPTSGTARVVLSGGTLTLTVDGTPVATVTGVTNLAERAWIGTQGGTLDNWKVWNTP